MKEFSLRQELAIAEKNRTAIGHFNVSTIDMMHGIVEVALELQVPVIIGISEGERDYIGIPEAIALISVARNKGARVYLNADHTYSVERVKQAIDAGFDSVIFDAAKETLETNIALTRECVEYAKTYGKDVLIEGELGYIGQSSKVLDSIPEGVALDTMMTTPEDASRYVRETGVDLFAPAVGNIHGMLSSGHDPKLDISRVANIAGSTGLPLVLHGGSGNDMQDFRDAIQAGIRIVHISTELRVAYKKGIQEWWEQHKDEVAPYKYLGRGKELLKQVVREKLMLFNRLEQ